MSVILVTLLTALLGLVVAQPPEEISGEYCFLDDFEARCNGTDVIFMTSANYGRMKAGKCIRGEVGFLGCSKDILTYMDRECSGRTSCVVKVVELRDLFNACSKELFSYLEASYVCQPVSVGDVDDCSRFNESRVTDYTGALFSGTAHTTPMGTSACPWFIQVLPGQQIKLTLFDFTLRDATGRMTRPGRPGNSDREVTCAARLAVREGSGPTTRTGLCAGSEREKHVYTTGTSSAQVWLTFADNIEETPYFLLSYEAVGCPAFSPPPNMWVTVDSDIATVVCNFTGETWYLICRGTAWVGELGNCTKVPDPTTPPGQSSFPWGILIAVGIGVAIGTVVGLALLGLVFLCRRCICPPKKRNPLPTTQPSLTARDVPPMNELIRSATVMAKQGDPRAPQAGYQTHAQMHPYTTQKFSHQVEYHPQGPMPSRDEHVYESYIYKDGTIRSRKDSATESTGSGYCDMDGSSVSDFPGGPPIRTQPQGHVPSLGPTTAHPVGGGDLDK